MRERLAGRPVKRLVRFVVVACLCGPAGAIAQTAPTGPLTLNDAVQTALKNYPAIRERRARALRRRS